MDDREALLWDLAGQEDYRLIHRLFLEETALALLLINPQKDDPFLEAGDWLKALETAQNQPAAHGIETPQKTARAAARLLVFSQIDVGGMKVSNTKIDRFCAKHGFHGWIATSAKSGENCSDARSDHQPSHLKQLIADSIPWDTLPWTNTPRLLAELKNALLAMRDEADIRLLRFAELAQRLRRALPGEVFQESDVRTAVTLLANHGLARPLKFGDLVLLQPELLNGYAGAVIRAARAHTDEIGCVAESRIHDAAFDFTGVDRLARPDEELLLRALVQTFLDHSLCIAEDTGQGKQLVFPSQYRREKDIPWQPDVFVSYTFEGEWQTIWTTLVVRLWYSNEFEHRELWRNAAEFVSSRGQLLGLKIDNRQGEGEATISLFFHAKVPDELKVIFIEYVHRHLARYAANVRRDRRYVCPECGTPVTNLDAVRRRLEKGKDFITCQDCDERVPFRDFIEERLESDPVARKILEMEKTAKRELDNQALEQILTGHMMAVCGEAGQIFRELTKFDYGIDGEVEFKDNEGRASGRKIYVQLKSGNSYLRTRGGDGREVFDVKNERHLEYWGSQPVDVYLVIRQTGEERMGVRGSDEGTIRWMNVTRYLKERKDKESRQIIFDGENLTRETVLQVRDRILGGAG
uniref:Ras family protein n=1 Tax=Candidatus Kentrum sp. FW TaxID=2126338 RepID=A0A450SUL0_9GAMM|nr:MAG: Ras family protein [Candidatus Kentron sp. FW]